jgi:hypothetical protein
LPQRNAQNAKKKDSFFVLFSSAKACLIGQAAADGPFCDRFISGFFRLTKPSKFQRTSACCASHIPYYHRLMEMPTQLFNYF